MNKFKIPIILIGALIFGESASLIYFAGKSQDLSKKLEAMTPDYQKLDRENRELKNKFTASVKENETLKVDRDNVLAQTKSLMGEKTRANELAASLEKANLEISQLQKEKQEIQNYNLSLKEKFKKYQELQAQITKERDDFKLAYEAAKKDATIKKSKKELVKLGKEKISAEINLKNKEIEQLKAQRTKLEEIKKELTSQVKEQKKAIAQAINKNRRLEEEVNNLPKKFSEIARQNKRLIRETAEMHYNLGVFYTKNKEYERALAEFEKVVEITPEDAYAHFNLGYIYAEYLINRKKAVEHFRHYLQLAKSDDKDVDWVKKYLLTWETYEGKKPVE
ncbi:MAG: tetratricopeptide repeat protein [Candidatus Omnitrophica bacterium]|nr:tetratricopeptide repeat protein [Candidatus Omnitrophota bacterium]